jgi:DUF971 family protein
VTEIWPLDIRVRSEGRTLNVDFDGGLSGSVTAELLRVESPSAEVKGHGPGQEQLVWGKRNVRIKKVEAVGNYAIRITFDDGHSTGIYTWPYLQKLVTDGTVMFSAYETRLSAAGLTRG